MVALEPAARIRLESHRHSTAGKLTLIVQGVGEWLSEMATVKVWEPAAAQTYFVVADEAARKEPAVALQAKESVSPVSASDAATNTSIWPPDDDVAWGEVCHEESTGQLSPATTVPVMMIDPGVPPSVVTLPQVIVTGTGTGAPEVTLNGELVPLQATPWLVVVVMVTVSFIPVGTLTSIEGVAFGSDVFTVPEARTTLADDSSFQATELMMTPPGRANATSM